MFEELRKETAPRCPFSLGLIRPRVDEIFRAMVQDDGGLSHAGEIAFRDLEFNGRNLDTLPDVVKQVAVAKLITYTAAGEVLGEIVDAIQAVKEGVSRDAWTSHH